MFGQLSREAKSVLLALGQGSLLKSHRYLDGTKVYRLHSPTDEEEPVRRRTVEQLLRRGFVTSNQKFPAATYMITPKGQRLATRLSQRD